MINDTYIIKKGVQGGIFGVLLIILLISGLFLGFSVKEAQALDWDLYYSVEGFYGDIADNSATLQIKVKTSFSIQYRKVAGVYAIYPYKSTNNNGAVFTITKNGTSTKAIIDPFTILENGELKYPSAYVDSPFWITFDAGKTYQFKLSHKVHPNYPDLLLTNIKQYYSQSKGWFYLSVGDTIKDLFYDYPANPNLYNSNTYNYVPVPEISVDYPFENATIAEAFDIIGDYSVPSLDEYNLLLAEVKTADTGTTIYFFHQDLETATGTIDLRISGIPAGSYELGFMFYFRDFGGAPLFISPLSIPFELVQAIPFELPDTQEQPPEFFSPISPEYIYQEHSNYATSTILFNTLTGALKPIITTLGDNMVFFTAQFEQDRAKETGQDIGNAIIVIRTYASNINAFFNDLPVSEVLFFYLILLVVVAIFRIIRQAIGLIPFT